MGPRTPLNPYAWCLRGTVVPHLIHNKPNIAVITKMTMYDIQLMFIATGTVVDLPHLHDVRGECVFYNDGLSVICYTKSYTIGLSPHTCGQIYIYIYIYILYIYINTDVVGEGSTFRLVLGASLIGISAARLPMCLSNFRAIGKVYTQISRRRDLR